MPKGRRSGPSQPAKGARGPVFRSGAAVPSTSVATVAPAAAARVAGPAAPAGRSSVAAKSAPGGAAPVGPEPPPPPRREEADWFLRLPAAVQEEYRERWRAEESRAERRVVRAKEAKWQAAARGFVVFLLCNAMFGAGGWIQLGIGAVLGAVVGLVWLATDAGRFQHILIATPVWMVLDLAFVDGAAAAILFLFGLCFHASLCVISSQIRDWRVADGDEV